MAITKKTTAVKKSDPPKKKFSPNAAVKNPKGGSYYYEEGVRGGGQGPLKSRSLTKEQKQGMFNASLITGSKNPLTAKMIEKRQANFYGTAKKKK